MGTLHQFLQFSGYPIFRQTHIDDPQGMLCNEKILLRWSVSLISSRYLGEKPIKKMKRANIGCISFINRIRTCWDFNLQGLLVEKGYLHMPFKMNRRINQAIPGQWGFHVSFLACFFCFCSHESWVVIPSLRVLTISTNHWICLNPVYGCFIGYHKKVSNNDSWRSTPIFINQRV